MMPDDQKGVNVLSEKMDRRRAMTKKLLHQAVIELIREQGLEHITVSAIIRIADINRSTFYLHYKDALDILEQVKNEIWEGLRVKFETLNPYNYLAYAEKNEPDPALVDVVEYFAEHTDFFKTVLGPKGDPAFAARMKSFLQDHHLSTVARTDSDLSESLLPKDYMIAYFAASNISILLHWMESGMRHSTHAVALMITHIVSSGAKHLFGVDNPPSRAK